MKQIFKLILVALFLMVNTLSCDLINGGDSDVGSLPDYSNQLADLSNTNEDFVNATHDLLAANFNNLSVSQINSLMEDFIETGENFVANLEAIEKFQKNSNGSYSVKSAAGGVCSTYDVIPTLDNGVGVGLAKSVGDIISETKGDMKKIQKMWENGEIDDNQYKEATDELRKKKLLKAGGLTIGAIVGTGAAVVTGAVVGTATLPAIATVAVVGGVVGGTVTWFANWYSGANKSATDEANTYFISGKTTNGGTIPLSHIKEGSNLTIVPEGMAPITISNFKLPQAGINRTIEFVPKSINETTKEEAFEVCYIDEPLPANSCNDILFINAYPVPSNPAPGEDVTVYAETTPAISGCNIYFKIVGSDGYADSETVATNSQGKASFHIPGAEEETVDVVSVESSNGKKYTITYVF